MKMKTRYKRILGLFVLTFIILFGGSMFTSAADIKDEVKGSCKLLLEASTQSGFWSDRYSISLNYNDTKDQYEISMADTAPDGVNKDKIAFRLRLLDTFETEEEEPNFKAKTDGGVSYSGGAINRFIKSGGVVLKPGGKIVIDKGVVSGPLPGLHASLTAEGFTDSEFKSCGVKTEDIEVNLFIEVSTSNAYSGGTVKSDISSSSFSAIDYIDCTNYESFDHEGFDYKFCYAKAKAIETNRSYDFGKLDNGNYTGLSYEKKWGKNDPFKFKCAYKYKKNGVEKAIDSQTEDVLKNDSEYYLEENTQYIYGKGDLDVSAGTYTYHYEKGTKTEEAKCSITCEESVVVEYGPPVASKAGLCFQYKVKVTSRVSCQQKEGGITVPREANWCTPTPLCVHSGGSTYRQGGPNEQFDACVNKCDKGKYTDKCVNKCYKKVYGKKGANKTDTTLALYEARKIADNDNDGIMDAPKYRYKDGTNEIIWDYGRNDGIRYPKISEGLDPTTHNYIADVDPTWHKHNKWGCGDLTGYTAYHETGIPKKTTCTDTCSWIGCKGDNIYLNEEQAQMDVEANKEVYERLEKECKAAASCTSTTAEFTISVDYTQKGKSEKKTINFPYTSMDAKNKDQLSSHGSENKDSIINTSTADNTTILKYDGCYKDEDQKRWYQTEWTFPGTWINNKTYEISYKPVKTIGWRAEPNKYCVPLNAKDVNTKWWLYYYATKYSNNGAYAVNNKDYINNSEDCKTKSDGTSDKADKAKSCNYGSATFTSDDAKNIEYNIHATTKRFGYFGWYIDVDCFYALYEGFDCSNNSNNKQGSNNSRIKANKTCTDGNSEYRVRAVDLKNLFPSSDGSKLTSTDTTGRSPGYNWSKYATQETKDTAYQSFPEKYTKWIQSKGYSVYSDQYLDYYIPLTKEEINKIKKAGKNYTDYKGSVDVGSTTIYKSDLIRNEIKGAKYPNGQALKCNNMKNYSSSECEKVEEAK